MVRIDAHQHYWSPAHGDYGWLQPSPALAPICRDFGPADLHPLLDAAAIDTTVLVQAAPSEAETWRLLALADDETNRVAAVVGWCDLLAPDAPRRVEQLAAQPRLRGLRPMLQDIADSGWILDARLQPAIDALIAHGLAFDALVQPRHLGPLLSFLQRHPQLRVVVDHGAKPQIARGTWEPWAVGIAHIARKTSACCKLSGLLTEAGPGWTLDRLRPYVEHLLAEFGPDRLLWGSDWPVLTLAADYGRWHEASLQLLQSLSAEQRARVFGGNAAAFYRLAC